MGNCCAVPSTTDNDFENKKGKNKANPFALDNGGSIPSGNGYKPYVLENPTGNQIEQTYVLGRELGRGEFGVTYLCTDKSTGEVYACKSISKKKLRTRVDVEDVRREVEIMKHMPPHPNIVSLKDTYEDDSAVHLVMELCEGGELFDRIVARGHYTERAAAGVTKTIVEVIQMCHKHGVMHRDLKPENFLFENKKETAALKAIDFGLSVFFKPGERFNEIVGSPYYMAPEVLKRNYGPEVDVWSAGVILYILLCGVPPFWAETEQGVAQAIIRSVVDFKRDPWPKVSDSAKDLVKKMLNPDPKLRLTAQEVLDHPWIQNAKKAPNVSLGETVKARLKQFSVMNKLKKRALRVIAEHLSAEEVAGIKQGFDLMDTSKQGKINITELKAGLQKLGQQIPDADLQILMDAGDVDKDGYLNYGEFVAISVHLRKMGNDDHLKDAFAFFDQNKSGYIEIEELREALSDELEPNNEAGIGRGQKGNIPNRPGGGWQGQSNNRMGRGGRVRPTGRDGQPVNMQVPMMGSPFGPLGMPPPGGMQPLTPAMSPGPGPPMSPAVFIPPFSPPVVWPGVVPPGGPSGPIFPPNIGTPQNPAMFFNQPGPVRGMPPNILGPGFNPLGPMGRGQQQDKGPGGWIPPRNNGPPGKAPSRGEQNDYSQNFVDTGMRPQNFIRELELTSVVEDYPKLRELIQKKDEIVANSASAPMYYKCDLREHVLSPEFFGTKFDVILVDPPWEEYVHRAPGVTDHMDYWTFEEIMNLKIEAIADTPCFVFLWVGDGVGLEQGRQCLKKWGFRRCEDICWVKTNKTTATPGLRHDSHTLFQRSKEHCLMGIKGTVRRSTDGHIIHANIDTDVIIAEEPPYGSTAKPEDMYRIIEHFSLGRRRLELFGEDHNIRAGWLTVGKDLSSSNFNSEGYVRNFADKDGKVWQGGGGRNPPPEAGHLVLTTPDIEALRPKSPMKNQLQMQQQSQQTNTISLTPGSGGGNKRPGGNDPLSHNGPGMNQEASSSNISGPVPWGPPMGGPNEGFFDNMYGYNGPFGPMGGEFMDFETQRAMNNMM